MASEETMAYLKGLANGTRFTPGQHLALNLYGTLTGAVMDGMDPKEAFGAILTTVALVLRQQPPERHHTAMLEVMSHLTTAVYGDDN